MIVVERVGLVEKGLRSLNLYMYDTVHPIEIRITLGEKRTTQGRPTKTKKTTRNNNGNPHYTDCELV